MQIVIAILSLIASLVASAEALPGLEGRELCLLESEDGAGIENISSLNVKEAESLSSFHLSLVNQHLVAQQYTQVELRFSEIKQLFGENGAFAYDDLYVNTFRVISSGRKYIQVKSYPGDNPYGLIFSERGQLLANNGDGSISLIGANGPVYCSDLAD